MRQILKHIEHTKKRWSGHEEWPFTSIWSQLASWCPHESKPQIANPEKEEPGSRITRTLHRSPNRHTNVLVETKIRCITPHIRSSPSCVTNVACIPNWSIQKHGFLRESLPFPFLHFPHHFSINQPLYEIWTPLYYILMKRIRIIKPQIMNFFSVPSPCTQSSSLL